LGICSQTHGHNSQGHFEVIDSSRIDSAALITEAVSASVVSFSAPPSFNGQDNLVPCYNLRRYASNAGRSAAVRGAPRSTMRPFDETIGGKLGGGFPRVARLKKAS
jgi:hypothetical protein